MMVSKAIVDDSLRKRTISMLGLQDDAAFTQTSNQSFKTILEDENGVHRLVEVRIVVGTVEETRSAEERLAAETAEWQAKKDKAIAIKAERAAKAEKDAEKRRQKNLEKKKEKEGV